VVDGLDEAGGDAFDIAGKLLVRLASFATVIVSTRNLMDSRAGYSLLDVLTPSGVINLDAPAQRVSQREAVLEYVGRRLRESSGAMSPARIGNELIDRVGGQDSFLLARIVTDRLITAPIDTSLPNWQHYLVQSIKQAFEVDLAKVSSDGLATLNDDTDLSRLAHVLLVALTWGLGAGFPEDEWLAVASALAGQDLDTRHASWVCTQLGRYIVQDGEGGVAVYRITHESLAEYLRAPFRPAADRPFDPAADTVWGALARRYDTLLRDGRLAQDAAYLWRYGHRHASAAGASGIAALQELTSIAPALRPSLAQANLDISGVFEAQGEHRLALSANREAVSLFRAAAEENPLHAGDLALVLGTLGVRYRNAGQPADSLPPAEEAVDLYRTLAAAIPSYRSSLAGALGNLSNSYGDLARFDDAVDAAEQAVEIYSSLAASSRQDETLLAQMLVNLGVPYRELERYEDAQTVTEQGLEIYRRLAPANPALRPSLATALGNLGLCKREMGQDTESLAIAEEVTMIFRDLASDSSQIPNLATALGNLGIEYGRHHRPADALKPTEEAALLFRELASQNPTYLPRLASTVANLGSCYRMLHRPSDASAAMQEAVTTYRNLASTNGAHKVSLAKSLRSLVRHLMELRSPQDALPFAQEAVSAYQDLALTDSSELGQLTLALTDLGGIYRGLGRLGEAVTAHEEAVVHLRTFAADDRSHKSQLAWTLSALATCFTELGRPQAALEPAEEATRVFRELAAVDPIYRLGLGGSLIDVGNVYRGLNRLDDDLAATEEATQILGEIAASNPVYQRNWATAMGNLSLSYAKLGRSTDAVHASERTSAILRRLVADDESYRPDLARTLINLGAQYIETDSMTDALAVTQEAVALYRDLAATVPYHLAHLAGALSNLGACLRSLGQLEDAVHPAEEAVSLYRRVAGAESGRLWELASSLRNLESLLEELGDSSPAEKQWEQASESLADGPLRAELLMHRANGLMLGDWRAVDLLRQAISIDGIGPEGLTLAHEFARRHRNPDPESWDAAWTAAAGETLPQWMSIDPETLDAARTWVTMNVSDREQDPVEDLRRERDWIVAHPELLSEAADTAIDEALLPLSQEVADRYRTIRNAAQTTGIDAAYEKPLAAALIQHFAAAEPASQRQMLSERRTELTSETVELSIQTDAADDDNPQTKRAYALLTLAAQETGFLILDDVFDALEEPQRFSALLHTLAAGPDAATLLPLAATIARTAGDTGETLGLADVFAALAAAINDDTNDVESLATSAVSAAPNERDAWILQLTELASVTPAAVTVIAALIKSTGARHSPR
jgi:hypothetical protein